MRSHFESTSRPPTLRERCLELIRIDRSQTPDYPACRMDIEDIALKMLRSQRKEASTPSV